MAIKHIVDNALKTPMSRKEFLGQVGSLLLAVIGVTSVLHALGGHKTLSAATQVSDGYGASAYGGLKR